MGGIKSVNKFSRLESASVEPLKTKKVNNEQVKRSSVSKTAIQEHTGLSRDMQKFLAVRSFSFTRQLNNNAPPPGTPPTTPNNPPIFTEQETPPPGPPSATPPTTTLPPATTYFTEPLFSEGFLEKNDDLPFLGRNDNSPVMDANGQPISDGNEVSFNDVMQGGGTGNCFLMGSIAAIARTDPQAIKDMIQPNVDANGNTVSYTVTLYDNGNPVGVVVTPEDIVQSGARPGDNGEMWVAVIEAAYGEFVGGNTDWDNGGKAGGLPSNAMEILTGRPSAQYGVSTGNYSFEDLQADFNSGSAITLSTPGNLTTNQYWIYSSHTYTVESVYVDENGQQMVQLYNPWGHKQPPPIPFSEIDNYFSEVQVN